MKTPMVCFKTKDKLTDGVLMFLAFLYLTLVIKTSRALFEVKDQVDEKVLNTS